MRARNRHHLRAVSSLLSIYLSVAVAVVVVVEVAAIFVVIVITEPPDDAKSEAATKELDIELEETTADLFSVCCGAFHLILATYVGAKNN